MNFNLGTLIIFVLVASIYCAALQACCGMMEPPGENWRIVEAMYRALPFWFDRRGDGIGGSILNGLFFLLYGVCGPITAFWIVRLGYPCALWGGLGFVVWKLSPRITSYPNLDSVLWPVLAAGLQAFVVWRLACRARKRGHGERAEKILRFGPRAGLMATVLTAAYSLVPMVFFCTFICAQVFWRWLFA